jgi:hypothetical protein
MRWTTAPEKRSAHDAPVLRECQVAKRTPLRSPASALFAQSCADDSLAQCCAHEIEIAWFGGAHDGATAGVGRPGAVN